MSSFPIRWRLTIYYALAILGVSSVLAAIIAIVAIRGTGSEVEEKSHALALEAARRLESGGSLDTATLDTLAGEDVFLVVRDGDGRVVAESAHPAHDIEEVSQEERTEIWRAALAEGALATGASNELYVYALRVDAPVRVIEAWKSYDTVGQNIIPYGRVAIFVLPLLLLVAILGSYPLARSSLAPVDAIVRAAREIGERDLSRRLPVQRPRDELGRLASPSGNGKRRWRSSDASSPTPATSCGRP